MKELVKQQGANIAKVVIVLLWLLLMNFLMSCSSSCPRKPCPTRLKRCTLVSKDTIPDYFYLNNQIVMIKKERN